MKKPLILLAEDNQGDVLLVQEALRSHGLDYVLALVSDGSQAAEYIEKIGLTDAERCPDVVLLDLNLPKRDGHEVLRLFRAHPLCGELPVIVITSSNAERDRRLAAEGGATCYFQKPSDLYEFIELGALVAELVEKREADQKNGCLR